MNDHSRSGTGDSRERTPVLGVSGITVLILAALFFVGNWSDLQWILPSSTIRRHLLREIPPGTPRQTVDGYFATRGVTVLDSSDGQMRVALGSYFVVSQHDVYATVLFDWEGGALSSIRVWKEDRGILVK